MILMVFTSFQVFSKNFVIEGNMYTDDAILKGVLNSIIGVINCSFNPVKDILITCGGDSELITSILKSKNLCFSKIPVNLLKPQIIITF